MNVTQVAALLRWSRDDVKTAIDRGIAPHGASGPVRLSAVPSGDDLDISEHELEAFVSQFEAAEPGRHPPIKVRRRLLVEARERCCICGEPGPFEFHHLVDWARLKHHDADHMMLLCRNCHGKCTDGRIDGQRQRFYKTTPYWRGVFSPSVPGNALTWDDLRMVVTELHASLRPAGGADSRHDYQYVDIERKNELNRLSTEYFATWRKDYEPKLVIVKRFLGDERNSDVQDLYYDIVGDLRAEIATIQGRDPTIAFDDVLKLVFEAAFAALSVGPRVNRESLRTVVAFMYFECDIGRKE